MEKKYPVLKCNEELWKEIQPVLESWGINEFENVGKWSQFPYLLSNYGYYKDDIFKIEACCTHSTEFTDSLRYLVITTDEFLEGVAKLLGKEYKPKKQFENKDINKDNIERINIAEKLKNCPKGFKLYSKIHGNVEFKEITDDSLYCIYVTVHDSNGNTDVEAFNKFGLLDEDYPNGECLLFPSKEQQDWNKFYYLEERHRVMCSDDGVCWYLQEYFKNNLAFHIPSNGFTEWKYIVSTEDFDFQTKNISNNIKKSIV